MKKQKKKTYLYRIDWFTRNTTTREILGFNIIMLRCDIKYLTNTALVRIIKNLNGELTDKEIPYITNILFQGYRAR